MGSLYDFEHLARGHMPAPNDPLTMLQSHQFGMQIWLRAERADVSGTGVCKGGCGKAGSELCCDKCDLAHARVDANLRRRVAC
jgi:hypothetical protein